MFRSLIHLDLVLIQGNGYVSNFILLLVSIQFSLHHLLKMASFLHHIFLATLLDIHIWIFDFVPLVICLLLCQYRIFITVAL